MAHALRSRLSGLILFSPLAKNRWWILILLFLSVLYLLVVGTLPVEVPYSTHDDGLFIEWARNIERGQWLGRTYGELTLAKGVFHSLVMAAAHRLGFHPEFGLRTLYLISAIFFCSFALGQARLWIQTGALLCLLLDPLMFSGSAFVVRLLRESTYIPLLLMAIGASVAALDKMKFVPEDIDSGSRWESIFKPREFWLMILLAASSFGLLLITREARIFIFVLVFTLAALFVRKLWNQSFQARKRFPASACFAVLFSFVLILQLPLLAVSQANREWYGAAITNEFEEGAFKSFYQDLISVQVVGGRPPKPWVPLSQDSIAKIISLNPQSVLGITLINLDQAWTAPGCEHHKEMCGEFGGGWFMWAWRGALFKHYLPKNAAEFQDLTRQAHDELSLLCAKHPDQIDCVRKASGYLPLPSRWGHQQPAPLIFLSALGDVSRSLFTPARILGPITYGPKNISWKTAKMLDISLPARGVKKRLSQSKLIQVLFEWACRLRAAMFVALVLIMALNLPSIRNSMGDYGIIFFSVAIFLQGVLLALISITSFNAVGYIALVSPLLTAAVWRWIAILTQINSKSRELSFE